MCTTCGCSGTIGGESAVLLVHDHGHLHEHSHAHDDPHDHPHEPGHGDSHGHAHDQELPRDARAMDSTGARTVQLEQDILAKNHILAERNRGWFEGRGVLALNLMSAPGSGKTSLLERTIRALGDGLSISVVEGDQASANDAERIRATGCAVIQVNPG